MSYQTLHPVYETKLRKAFKKLKPSELQAELQRAIYKHNKNTLSATMLDMIQGSFDLNNIQSDPLMEMAKTNVVTDELFWNQQGRQVIFVESKEFVDAILSSKFDVDVVKNLQPLSNSFQLVLPKGCTDKHGNELPNVLVNWFKTGRESMDMTTGLAREAYEANGDDYSQVADSLKELKNAENITEFETASIKSQIVGSDDVGYQTEDFQILNMTMTFDDLNKPICVKSMYEHRFADALTKDANNQNEEIINSVLKLILGLAIYIDAGGFIRDGFPTQKAAATKARKSLEKTTKAGFKVKFISFAKEMKSTAGGFVRGFHFRNLKADRYYQGEFKNRPKGSRWVFVNPSWVGGKVSPKTAHL